MKSNLPTPYQNFIHKSRYARWDDSLERREMWEETVDRYLSYICDHIALKHNFRMENNYGLCDLLRKHILELKTMPSMRAMMTAGAALARDNVCGYNCSYIPVDSPRAFDECMYILMCGTGVGFSVERRNIDKLPTVNEHFEDSTTRITVADSRAGWARALRELIAMLYVGQVPELDVEDVRPSGAKLNTMGGRASGPTPLIDLYHFAIKLFKKAKGRKLYPIECHDLMCKIGEVVVVGGVRRSALISLSNLNDDQMRHAKSGDWWKAETQRALSNNSIAYKTKPEMETFMREWLALYESKSGERGMFNREAADNQVSRNGRRETGHDWGTNPCSEIILRPYQFCNLSEVVVRSEDTLDTLKDKVRVATILGTFQSTLTDFKYLRKIWKQNTEEERLLGVSLTGIMDHNVLSKTADSERWIKAMKQVAIDTNQEYAAILGIPQSVAITCVKPSGTVSQLVDASSGIHARHNNYYIRTVRADNNDPLTQFLKSEGIPNEPDVTKPTYTTVFSFPVKAPDNAITRKNVSAVEQLVLWKIYAEHWCEHKPSVTVSVKEEEWMEVGAWVYRNFDIVSGISFLPYDDHVYQQAPYQDCTEEDYTAMLMDTPKSIDFQKLSDYEKEDHTNGNKELACSAGVCEVVDIGGTT